MIVGFKHRGLKTFFETGNTRGIRGDHARRIGVILEILDTADRLENLRRPSLRLHQLIGDRHGTWSVSVNAQWRITFTYEDGEFDDLDLEQYH